MTSPTVSWQQRIILLLLARNYRLRYYVQDGKWIDTCDNQSHSPANCRWLLENNYLQLVRSVRLDAARTIYLYGISELGRAAIAETTAKQPASL